MIFVGFDDDDSVAELTNYATIKETTTSSYSSVVQFTDFFTSFRVTRDFGTITMNILFGAEVAVSTARLAISFPD